MFFSNSNVITIKVHFVMTPSCYVIAFLPTLDVLRNVYKNYAHLKCIAYMPHATITNFWGER